jgi:outer membrane biogenesis lipoprotein LolB
MRRLLLWLVAHAAAKTKYDVVDRDDATTFGILIDAGSTGSRVHIYQWEKRDFNTLPPPLSLPLTSERWTERIKPGLSDYNDDAERAARTSVPAWTRVHGAFTG